MAARNLKDAQIEQMIETAPNSLFIWYAMAGYCYYILGVSIVSQGMFDRMKSEVIAQWMEIVTPIRNPFKLSDIKNEVGWDKLSTSLKQTAKIHADEVTYKNNKALVTQPSVPMVAPPPKQQPVKHGDWARMRVEGRINVDFAATSTNKKQLDFICTELGMDCYAGILYASSNNKAELSARLMRALQLLQEQNIKYNSYTMVEVLIDSAKEDVWSFKKFQQSKSA